ncbi:hypothetical protein [Endozoicomonas sp. 8E]|nr:hypothetical protein [Endozoicomonas sp. 8E]WOG26942.1 hypothetical protein P6910_20690 [Endozoicomonas sp. 8E]
MALNSRLRGNDDLRAWERAIGVLRHPLYEEDTKTIVLIYPSSLYSRRQG